MKVTCPHCGKQFDTAKAKAAPTEALNALYARFGHGEELIREYMRLFSPDPLRPMSTPKETRLVADLLKIWESEYFTRNGRGFKLGRDIMAVEIRRLCNVQPELRGEHGYLLTVFKTKAVQLSIKEDRERQEREAAHRKRVEEPIHPDVATVITKVMNPMDSRISATSIGQGVPDDPVEVERIRAEARKRLGISKKPRMTQAEIDANRERQIEIAKRMQEGGN